VKTNISGIKRGNYGIEGNPFATVESASRGALSTPRILHLHHARDAKRCRRCVDSSGV